MAQTGLEPVISLTKIMCVYLDVFPIITIQWKKIDEKFIFISPLRHILLRLQESNLLSVGYEPPMISVFVVTLDVSVSLCHDVICLLARQDSNL